MNKRTWGQSTLRYDPIKKVCWYLSRKGNVIQCKELPSYGLDREEMPNDEKR